MILKAVFHDGTCYDFPVKNPEELEAIYNSLSNRWSRTGSLETAQFKYDGGTKIAALNMNSVKAVVTKDEA